MKHPVVWFEVMGESGESLRSFYGRLFEWKSTRAGDTLALVNARK